MSGLTLRLQTDLDQDIATSAGAVATLRRVADEGGEAVRGGPRLDVTIPASFDGHGRRFDVEPGRWLVEATLPSGEILTEEVAVPSGEDVQVTLHAAENSPHEWLGWQHLIGNIEGKETLEQLQKRAHALAFEVAVEALPRELNRSLVEKIADKVGDLSGRAVAHVAREFGPFLKKYKVFRKDTPHKDGLRKDKAVFEPEPRAQDIAAPLPEGVVNPGEPAVGLCEGFPPLRDGRAWEAVLDLSHAPLTSCPFFRGSREEALYLYRVGEKAQPSARDFAHVAWGEERFAVSLPIPWPDAYLQSPVPVEMMVRLRPQDGAVNIGVAVLDREFGPLVGLMTASTQPQAKVIVEQAHGMLFGKFENPLAAAAGGYVLLAVGGSEQHPEWHGWIENLAKAFPTLPDGAILKASLRLLYPTDQGSYDEARASLFEAFDRGIPYFSAGVARLLDGLTLFPDDAEAKERMMLVQRVAQRLDLSQAFTVIRLSDRKKQA
jgi:hypothetical protein